MRIITGIARGRKIVTPEGLNTRPTSDRVKESVFNIIQGHIPDAKILDLFAGTGNLGLEAISRGAESCVFIEQDRNTYKVLTQNIKSLGFESQTEAYNQEALAAVSILSKRGKKFDVIFLDPPYGRGLIKEAIQAISKMEIGEENSIIISEYDFSDEIPETIGIYNKFRTEKYGRTKVSFWRKE
jgi:16S rRNA (guanine966-N2)-methyltransferase